MTPKTPSESKTTQTEIVLPNDTNNLNNLMGGRLLHWMDIVAAVTAQRHSERTCVTASVNNVSFGIRYQEKYCYFEAIFLDHLTHL